VWLFTGIWHGANWTFIAWGMIYFVILLIEKLTGFPNKLGNIASHIYTMFVVIIAWVVFRADSIGTAMVYIENMFGIGSTGVVDVTVLEYVKSSALVLVASCFGITPCIKQLSVKIQAAKAKAVELIWVCILFVLSLIMVISSTYNPFIYYNF
jgi:D-alanyl-lipoteichoic acid acyltransferase DltB (MBOAT superfamily)